MNNRMIIFKSFAITPKPYTLSLGADYRSASVPVGVQILGLGRMNFIRDMLQSDPITMPTATTLQSLEPPGNPRPQISKSKHAKATILPTATFIRPTATSSTPAFRLSSPIFGPHF